MKPSNDKVEYGHITPESRQTLWYHIKDVVEEPTCPSCGRAMEKFKMPLAHVKRCFSIKKRGPIYRLHGYVECKCGLLIADNSKARKLHVCLGEVPAYMPDSVIKKERSLSPSSQMHEQPVIRPVKSLERELLQPKPWIRNFVTPLHLESVQAKLRPKIKQKPRVRNFDMPLTMQEPQDVWVYSITHANDENAVVGRSLRTAYEPVVRLRNRLQKLQLPRRGSNFS